MGDLEQSCASSNEARRAAGLERRVPTRDIGEGLVDWSSSDVLGLSAHPALAQGAADFAARFGAGARAARLLGGGARASRIAEERFIAWQGGAIDALLFPSGYQANVATIGCLVGRGDAVLSDRLAHASLIDGARLSRARVVVHEHLDLEDLERALAQTRGARRRLVVTESVFSMDGDGPDLARIAELCREHDAWLYVDEAHAGGIVGERGRGAAADLELDSLVRLVTGGKALGAAGAFIAAKPEVIAHLAQDARGSVYTTGVSPLVAGALTAAIELVEQSDDARATLRARVEALASALDVAPGPGAILPYPVGDAERTMAVAEQCAERGHDVRGIRPPTVPAGTSRLRFVVHAEHTLRDIREVAEIARAARGERQIADEPARAKPLFVVGTDTDAGKTVASAMLCLVAKRVGDVRYLKPVQTGDDSDTQTVARLAALKEHQFTDPLLHFAKPASPHEAARAEGRLVEREVLDRGLRERWEGACGAQLIVELAGGLLVPLDHDGYDQSDFLAQHARELILVARSGLGTLNHTRLTLEALERRGLRPRALLLVGPPHESNRETLRPLVPQLVELPWFEDLDADALGRWVDDHFETKRLAELLP